MKTILVATDFSTAALNAAYYAAEMALANKARLVLLHVYNLPVSFSEIPVEVNTVDLMGVEKKITEVKDLLIRKTGSRLEIRTKVEMGVFFPVLKIVCDRIKPYAVVMGSQGTSAAERLFFGGHTVHAMKHLMWPLITVPSEAKFSSVKKIGLACDFDKVVDTTPAEEIKTLVRDFHAELHILNTGKKDEFKPDMVFESGLLQEMLSTVKPNYHFIINENTDEGIMDFAEKQHIDLLVVLPKRHSLPEKLIHKSHTKQLVLHSPVPVMALHHV